MSLKVTKTDTVMPASVGILLQLPAAIAATQVKMQGLVEKTTDALEAAEARATKLEAELIAAKAQHAADKAVTDAQIKNLEAMNGTLQKTLTTVLQRLAAVEDKAQHIRPMGKELARKGHVDLDYPGKREDFLLRKPVLEKEIAKLTQYSKTGGLLGCPNLQKLKSLKAELARIERYLEENKVSI